MAWLLLWGVGSALELNYIKNSEARCLDGSPYGFYLREGDPNRVLVHFEGGGSCGDLTTQQALLNCLERSKSGLGSSYVWPLELSYPKDSSLGEFIDNPNFSNWTIAFLPYCDGTLHHGYLARPVRVESRSLYFRGHANTVLTLERLLKGRRNLTLYFSGFSAGAIASVLYANHVERVFSPEKLVILPDSGLFFAVPRKDGVPYMETITRSFYNIWKEETPDLNPACTAENLAAPWRCLIMSIVIPYVRPPLLLVNSLVDQYSLVHGLGLDCALNPATCPPEDAARILEFRGYVEAYIRGVRKEQFGAWAINCIQHGFSENSDWTRLKIGSSPADHVRLSMQGLFPIEIDPSTAQPRLCHGLTANYE
jgi:hypothetical protein